MLTFNNWIYHGTWILMLLVSVANGAFRDVTYGKHMSELAAHQLSTLISVLLLGAVMWICIQFYPPPSAQHAIVIGLMWSAMTVVFEFLFFHIIGGHSWPELFANYNILEGRVWMVVVLWLATAPPLFFRLRHTP